MAEAGGSASAWQVLLLVRSEQWGTQSKLAEAMGVSSATVTHHLNALEAKGLVRRWRDDANRRVQRVELTDEGAALFERLRAVAMTPRRAPALAALRRGGRAARRAARQAARRARLAVVPEDVVHPGLLGGWLVSEATSPKEGTG